MLTAVASDAPPEAGPEAAPSADLLLYLGEFEDAGGEFVDPMSLEEGHEPAAGEDPSTVPATEDDEHNEAAPRSA